MANHINNLRSIGKLCSEMQLPYSELKRRLANTGVRPTLVIDDVPHFDDAAIRKLYATLPANPVDIACNSGEVVLP